MDILTAPEVEAAGSPYGLIEVKRFNKNDPANVTIAVNTRLNTYREHLNAGGINNWMETALNNFKNGVGWAVQYMDTKGNLWYAWAPTINDGVTYGGGPLDGHVYFAPAEETPELVKERQPPREDYEWERVRFLPGVLPPHLLPPLVPPVPSLREFIQYLIPNPVPDHVVLPPGMF